MEPVVVLTSGPFKGQEGILRRVDETVAEVETALGVTLKVSPEEVWIGEAPPMETWVGKPQGEGKPKPKKEEKKGRKEEQKQEVSQPEIRAVQAEEAKEKAEADKEFKKLLLGGLIECRDKLRCSLCGQALPGGKAEQVVEQYGRHRCTFVVKGRRTYYYWRTVREKGGIQYLHRVPPKTIIVGAKPLQVYWRIALVSLGAHGKVSVCGSDFRKVRTVAELVERTILGSTARTQLDGTVEVEE